MGVWDHKDLDKQNNRIANLRPVTQARKHASTRRGSATFYIWKADPDDWERCVSQRAAARAYNLNPCTLNDVLHKRLNKQTVPS